MICWVTGLKASRLPKSNGPNNFLPTATSGKPDEFGNLDYGINAQTYLFVNKGTAPRFDVLSMGAPVIGLTCTLTGNYLN